MNGIQKEEIETSLRRESRAKKYMLISFMFGVFFLATLKDLISAGFDSASVVIWLTLLIVFILLAVYFYIQANGALDDEDRDRLDDYREFLENNQVEEQKKQSFIDKYFTAADLESFKKTIYVLWGVIFVIFMTLALLSPAPPAEDQKATTTKTQTTTKTTVPAQKPPTTTTKPATTK